MCLPRQGSATVESKEMTIPVAQMAHIPGLGSQGRAMFATGTPANFDQASVVSVTATCFWTAKPPGTDTLKSHFLGSGGKTNLITAFIIQKSPLGFMGQSEGPKAGTSEKELQGPRTLHQSAA